MGIVQEFKEFAVKGNVVDLAVGVVIGAAFGKITSALVADFITPILGVLTGEGKFVNNWKWVLTPATDTTAEVAILYGHFIQTVIDFLIIAWVIFIFVKGINQLKRKEEAKPQPAPPAPPKEVELLTEIRDLLKK